MAIAVPLVVAQASAPAEPQAPPEPATVAAPDLALTAVKQTQQSEAGVEITATVRNVGRAVSQGGFLEVESRLGRYREPLPEVRPQAELPPITFRLPPRTDWKGPAGTYPVVVDVRPADGPVADANEANNRKTITVWVDAAPASQPQPPAPPPPRPRWWPPHWLVPAAGALAVLVLALASQIWRSRRPRPPSVVFALDPDPAPRARVTDSGAPLGEVGAPRRPAWARWPLPVAPSDERLLDLLQFTPLAWATWTRKHLDVLLRDPGLEKLYRRWRKVPGFWPSVERRIGGAIERALRPHLTDILTDAWNSLRGLPDSDEALDVPLGERSVAWSSRPTVSIFVNGARVGRLRLQIMVEVEVTGVTAVVRDARVESFSIGSYEGTVALYCEELLVDEEKVFEDTISGTIWLQDVPREPDAAPTEGA
jgi:hypothetical protein